MTTDRNLTDDEGTEDEAEGLFEVPIDGDAGIGTVVAGPYGPTATGAGNQYNYIVNNVQEEVRRTRRWVTDEQERELEPRFVAPGNWDKALVALQDRRIVLLRGPVGSGRRSAALRLLGECGAADGGHIHEVPWESDDSGTRALDPADVTEGSRLLLDLSKADDEQYQVVQKDLETFRGTVREQRAFLVVVLPASPRHLLRAEFQSLVVLLQRPDGIEVLCKHLVARAIPCTRDEIEKSPHVDDLGILPMREIAQLAHLAGEARDDDGPATTADLLARAKAAHTGGSDEAARLVKGDASGPYRALLLAVAMLPGCRADVVFTAEALLLDALRFHLDEPHELERPDLGTRLHEIKVGIDAEGRARFTALNYAEAVRAHFWTHFPGLRDGFRDWVIACVRRRDLPLDDRRDLVDRFAHQCLRVGRPDHLITAARAWTTDGQIDSSFGESALEHGLAHQRWGWRFRRQTYHWSRERNLPPRLAYAVILSCSSVLAGSWPGPAMVRLHHLTEHRDDGVSRAAEDALVELAGDRAFFRRLVARLTEWESRRLENQRSRRIFLRVAEPRRLTDATDRTRSLIDDSAVRGDLVAAWRSVLLHGDRAEYEETVERWLQAHSEGCGDLLLVVLADACSSEIRLCAALFAYGRRWLEHVGSVDAAARTTVRRLEAAIDRARESGRPSAGGETEGVP